MEPRLPVVLVSGLGRCGTSLMMQMLQRGGMKCAGEFPAFEPPETNHGAMPLGWIHQWSGAAVKLLDPHHSPLEETARCVVIWMDRDFYQQAKSQIKFALAMMGKDWKGRHGKHDFKKMEKQLQREDPVARASLSRFPMLRVRFEDTVNNPFAIARKIVDFLSPYDLAHALNPQEMFMAAIPRDVSCADGIDIELNLCAEADK